MATTSAAVASIRALAESANLTCLPATHIYTSGDASASSSTLSDQIPVIDFSLLSSASTLHRSKAVKELADACQNWGFFQVINHGIPESLMKGMMEVCQAFFNLTEEEKQGYKGNDVMDPIRCGTSFNTSVEKVFFWRDFLKVFLHPDFHSPENPPAFREISGEYSRRVGAVAMELMRAICEGLGVDPGYLDANGDGGLDMERSFRILIANFYPPCPQPELTMGLPSHSDHGLLTVLAQNGVDGLQLEHDGKWVDVRGLPNALLVNTADHLEILSNGRYKSVMHRAVVNGKATRISVAVPNGPSLDAVVKPAPELVSTVKSQPPRYMGMKYRDYIRLQQSNQLEGKSCLDRVRLQLPSNSN